MAVKPFTPSKLIAAIRSGLLDEVIVAIAEGADIEEPDMHGFVGLPLRTACFAGDIAIVRELLNRGADINAVASDGPGAPLRLAQRGKNQEILALLLAHGTESMPGTRPAPPATTPIEALPLRPDEAVAHPPVKAEEAPPALPDNTIEFTRDEPEATVDIEEIHLTSSYGIDTNLLTLDLLRMSESEHATVAQSETPGNKTSTNNGPSVFWKSRGNK
jgi:hypothetical protein